RSCGGMGHRCPKHEELLPPRFRLARNAAEHRSGCPNDGPQRYLDLVEAGVPHSKMRPSDLTPKNDRMAVMQRAAGFVQDPERGLPDDIDPIDWAEAHAPL